MASAPDFGEESYRGHGQARGPQGARHRRRLGHRPRRRLAFAREGADVAISYLEEEQRTPTRPSASSEAGRTRARSCRATWGTWLLPRRWSSGRSRSSAARHPRQQRGLPDGPRGLAGSPRTSWSGRSASTSSPCSNLQGGARAHAGGRDDHQHRVDPGLPARHHAAGLRGDQGGDRQLHQGPRAGGDRARHPRQRGRPRAGLDAADPGDDAGGEGRRLRRRGVADGAGRAAGRARSRLRLPRLPGVQLRQRRGHRRHRRQALS